MRSSAVCRCALTALLGISCGFAFTWLTHRVPTYSAYAFACGAIAALCLGIGGVALVATAITFIEGVAK